MTLLPGLRLVRNIDSFDIDSPDPRIEAGPTRDGIEVRALDEGERAIRHGPYRLKRFVYF